MNLSDQLIRQGLLELHRLDKPASSPPFSPLCAHFTALFPGWKRVSLRIGARLFASVPRDHRHPDAYVSMDDKIFTNEPLWRASRALERTMEKAQNDSGVAYAFLALHSRMWRRLLRKYLRKRFGFIAFNDQFVGKPQVFQNSDEALDFVITIFWATVYDEMFARGFDALVTAIAAGEPTNQQAAQAAQAMWQAGTSVATRFLDIPHGGVERGNGYSPGWVGGIHINLQTSPQRRMALEDVSDASPRTILRQRLPGAVLMATHPDEGPTMHRLVVRAIAAARIR